MEKDYEYEKELKENPPVEIEELPVRPGELLFHKMNEGDRFQLLTRYMNDLAVFSKNQMVLLTQCVSLLRYICEEMGIDVAKKEKETAAKMKKQIEDSIEESKKKLTTKD